MKKITRLKPPIRPAAVPPPGHTAPVHSLLCYRLANLVLALETGENYLAKEAERVLRAAGVRKAIYRRVGKTYQYRLHLEDGVTLDYVASKQRAAWAGAVGILHEHCMNQFRAKVAS